MCEVTEVPFAHVDPQGIIGEGKQEITMLVDKEDTIWINPNFISIGGVLSCRHPGTDWHVMELKPGEGLKCPAETELKLVLPRPYNRTDQEMNKPWDTERSWEG